MSQDLRTFLQEKIFPRFIPSARIDDFLQSQFLEMFETAFIHKSLGDRNYELYEAYGDRIIDANLYKLLIEEYGATSPNQLTILRNYFVSSTVFARFVEQLGFFSYIRSLEPLTEKVVSDVFESFVGVLTMVADQIQPFSGNAYAYQFLGLVYEGENIDVENYEKYANARTRIAEVFRRYLLGKVTYQTYQMADNRWRSTVVHPRANGRTLEDLGTGFGDTKNEAKEAAARNAIETIIQRENADEDIGLLTQNTARELQQSLSSRGRGRGSTSGGGGNFRGRGGFDGQRGGSSQRGNFQPRGGFRGGRGQQQ